MLEIYEFMLQNDLPFPSKLICMTNYNFGWTFQRVVNGRYIKVYTYNDVIFFNLPLYILLTLMSLMHLAYKPPAYLQKKES